MKIPRFLLIFYSSHSTTLPSSTLLSLSLSRLKALVHFHLYHVPPLLIEYSRVSVAYLTELFDTERPGTDLLCGNIFIPHLLAQAQEVGRMEAGMKMCREKKIAEFS